MKIGRRPFRVSKIPKVFLIKSDESQKENQIKVRWKSDESQKENQMKVIWKSAEDPLGSQNTEGIFNKYD